MKIFNFLNVRSLFVLGVIVVVLLASIIVVSAVDCKELDDKCFERSKKNCVEAQTLICNMFGGYHGCALDVVCGYDVTKWAGGDELCSIAYFAQVLCDTPGYVECADPAMAKYQDCLKSCNSDFRTGRSKCKTFAEIINERNKLDKCGAKCRTEAEAALASCREEALASGRDVSAKKCNEFCSQMGEHLVWDKKSPLSDCKCICELDYGDDGVKCVECEKFCKGKGDHWIYDSKNSEPGFCTCTCEDGFKPDSGGECKKVECPDNCENVYDLQQPSSPVTVVCPKDRELNRHCCCKPGYVPWGGVCIKKEDVPGKDGEGEEEKTAIEKERERLANKYHKHQGLKKGHVLYRQGKLSAYSGDDWGHVGLYIGDFTAGREYTVRDVPWLEVFRDGEFKMLKKGQTIKKGDMIIGAVIEMLESGAVLNTVEGFERMRTPKPSGKGKDMDWRTTRTPPTDNELRTIIKTAVSKVDLTEEGKLGYWPGAKGSKGKDLKGQQKEERFDCVSFVEYCFEKANLDPTPDHLEGGSILKDWFLRPDEQYKCMVSPPKGKNVHISVKSPVNLHLYDSEGRHVGVNPQGVVEREIPDAYYQLKVEGYPQGIKIIDVKDDYQLMIEALDEGSFNLRIIDRNVCTPGSMTEVDFQEVLITKGTKASLNLGSVGNEYLMGIDEDGDGKADQTLEPTSLKTLPLPAETAPERIGLTFESRSKPSGSSVQIPLTLNGIEEKIGNIDITLSYDPSVLEATEVIKGGLTANSIFDYNILNQGTIKISLADTEGFSGDGSITYVKFNVIGSEGSSSPLRIAAIAANRAEDDEALEIPTIDGVFRVIHMAEGIGDSDGDGKYTALDALCALQMAVEKIPEDLVMDMNGDGSVTSLDARQILRIAVGIESK